jgi:ABC-type polysaccharide/polyol phosphate transport system ATPase subunit
MNSLSSKTPVIAVKNVTKRFRYMADRPTSLKSVLVNFAKFKFDLGKKTEFYSLRNVSFDIFPGEFVGIMGRNGAGKSTLLKLTSGIYHPTEGKIQSQGQIAPLIELGAGFHPELSGYENIFLNAAILGAGRKVATEAVPAILEFSELAEKIYMPVKNYSSGMLVRLAFSIAIHFPAPILLVDEILAVGDAGFQAKCLKKIDDLHKEGRTIVLITHDASAVARHCGRCIVIEKQEKIFDGSAAEGVAIYQKLFA